MCRPLAEDFSAIATFHEFAETCFRNHIRCLEQEHARAFEEAREVSQDYGRFLELVGE